MEESEYYKSPVYANCMMTSSDNGTVNTIIVGLRNFTFFLDEIGVDTGSTDESLDMVFGLLLKLEFEDFNKYMSGKVMCDIYLVMEKFIEKLNDFATYDINFMVSRSVYDSGYAGVNNYLRSMKKIW